MKGPLALCALLLLAPGLEAQITKPKPKPRYGKKHGKGGADATGKKSRLTGSIRDKAEADRQRADAAAAKLREVEIRLGDRVRGVVGAGWTHRITFPAVAGTKIHLKVTPANRKLTLSSRLSTPGAAKFTLRPKPTDPAVLRLDDRLLEKTGMHTIEVSFAANQAGDYLVETSAQTPDKLEKDLKLGGRRPGEVRFGGLEGRRVDQLKVRAVDATASDLRLQLVDPDGVTAPLDAKTWRSTDGKTVLVSDLPIHANGDYRLFVMDRGGAAANVRVALRFDDAKRARRTHEL